MKLSLQIKLFCYHPVKKRQIEQRLEIHKDKTLTEATEIACKVRHSLENTFNVLPQWSCGILSVEGGMFDIQSSHSKDFKIFCHCLSGKHTSVR